MISRMLHTPEGVRDLYGGSCENMFYLKDRFHEMFQSFGYSAIQTPTYEFFDVFGNDIGTVPSRDLYKFFDRNGETLVLRPDITPSIARCAAKYFYEEKMPVKLYYMGNTFVNNLSLQGRLKEVTQAGAELIGDSSLDADAEMIVMAVRSLLSVGLGDFVVSIGHARFLNELIKEADLDESVSEKLFEYLHNRNYWGVRELVETCEIATDLAKLFGELGGNYRSADDLLKLHKLSAKRPEIQKIVSYLIDLCDVLECYKVMDHITFELGMFENKEYYTGVIFKGYTYGSGEAIFSGGRYDDLISHFGDGAPAIGFAFVVDEILIALEKQNITIPEKPGPILMIYDRKNRNEAIERASSLREKGESVSLLCRDGSLEEGVYREYIREKGFGSYIEITGDKDEG